MNFRKGLKQGLASLALAGALAGCDIPQNTQPHHQGELVRTERIEQPELGKNYYTPSPQVKQYRVGESISRDITYRGTTTVRLGGIKHPSEEAIIREDCFRDINRGGAEKSETYRLRDGERLVFSPCGHGTLDVRVQDVGESTATLDVRVK